MKKRIFTIILVLSITLALNACGQSNSQNPAASSPVSNEPMESADTTSNEESAPSSAGQELSEPEFTYYADESNLPNEPNIDGAPVEDLTNLKTVTEVYVWPLTINGSVWFQSWASPSEIPAGMLIYICAFNRFVEFSLSNPFAPAQQVEAALQQHFDVTTEYLRTASSYDAQKNVYQMPEGGGGWITVAMAAEQKGNQIIIKVGNLGPEETIPTPMGTLTIELTDQNIVKYISYQENLEDKENSTPANFM